MTQPTAKSVSAFTPQEREITDRLLTTTRSVRSRLDFDRPVDRSTIDECLEISLQAPSGGGSSAIRWIVVTDVAKRRELGELYRACNADYVAKLEAAAAGDPTQERAAASARRLTNHLADVPTIVAAAFDRWSWMQDDVYGWSSGFGSSYPAIWSFQLACRSRGLATCLVVGALKQPDQLRDILSLPAHFEPVCLVAVAHPDEDRFRPANRLPLREFVRDDTWSDGIG